MLDRGSRNIPQDGRKTMKVNITVERGKKAADLKKGVKGTKEEKGQGKTSTRTESASHGKSTVSPQC